jgi:histidinol-phosphatase
MPVTAELDRLLVAAQRTADAVDAIHAETPPPLQVDTKDDGSLLSQMDLAVEDAVHLVLAQEVPGSIVLGEERSATGDVADLVAGRIDGWILDPIDHTRHYVRGDAEFGMLLGFVREGEVLVSCISAPRLGLRAWASAGGGAFLNGTQVRCAPVTGLAEAEIAFAGFREWGGAPRDLTAVLRRCAYPHGTRGGFLQQVRVASGAVDAALEPWGAPWDHLPGALLVAEAGGRASALDGGPIGSTPDSGLLVSAAGIHDVILDLLHGRSDDERRTLT